MISDETIRKVGQLLYTDGEYEFYQIQAGLRVVPASEEELQSTFETPLDRAVREAGFATEPLRHSVKKLSELLYIRMLNSDKYGFTDEELEVLREARELLSGQDK